MQRHQTSQTTGSTPALVDSQKPWYKHTIPWLLLSAPIASIIAGAIFITIAVKTPFSMVADDYSVEGKYINRQIARDTYAKDAGLVATLQVSSPIVLHLNKLNQTMPFPSALMLTMVHPILKANDQKIVLKHQGNGQYISSQSFANMPVRTFIVESEDKKWRLISKVRPNIASEISLLPEING